jgi:hypothetical protein
VALTIISPTLAFGPDSGTITAISTLSAACADFSGRDENYAEQSQ